MTTYFGQLHSCLEDLVDQVAEDAQSVQTAIKSRGARLSDKQRTALEAIREETADLDELVSGLLGKPLAIKSVTTTTTADLVTNVGGAIKAIGSGRVEGYLVRYGGTGDLSQYRDIFQKAPGTDYGRRRTSDAYVHHRILPGLGERMLTSEAQLEPDEVGIFCKLLLDMGDQYEAALYKLTQQGKLGWSSGTAPHLVKRQRNADGSHTVKRWILGLDASLTPTPAGGLGMRAHAAMKSMLLDMGLDVSKPLPARRQDERALFLPGPASGTTIDTSDRWGIRR